MAIQEFQESQGVQVKQEKMVQREVQLGRNRKDGTQGARGICQLPSVDKTCVVIRNGISKQVPKVQQSELSNVFIKSACSDYYLHAVIPEPTARSAVPGVSPGRGLLIPHGYLHPGKCEHSEVQSSSMIAGASLWFMGGPPH